ncbi:hypothetical protein CU044_2174 [Streptomyces sp. L-9-10]|uniref:DUF6643 family protein n=1 Tax=unclassified Streptomyces TaxID=2593676 RepID=UPI00101D2B14|nr:DUF6643 family protein [Streptomyces sp. L-9-10]RYJ29081.1 hypothetical protein CU044_2174 [Streptomyces sp. L-9-10]
MTSPRATYGGGYYTAPSFPDTPIYDSLVAERGTPQIAPIRVPSAYDTGNSYLPALPAALPALPAAPSPSAASYSSYGGGYQQQAQQPMPLQHAPAPYIPQQAPPRGYPGQQPQQQAQPQRPMPGTGYEAMRPAASRPVPAAQPTHTQYDDPYNRPYQTRGY